MIPCLENPQETAKLTLVEVEVVEMVEEAVEEAEAEAWERSQKA